ncbi:MAG: helix-turn-helix transcriptional regulator [Flavipsychrobacter sp.]|nr:helix-turn-helix transcriptional regulator [Flavipsychrobacter sp.]
MLTQEKFKAVRSHLGLSQSEMAARLGIKQAYYSAIERGDKDPSKNVMERLFSAVLVNEMWWHEGKGNIINTVSIKGLNANEKRIELKKALRQLDKIRAQVLTELAKENADFIEMFKTINEFGDNVNLLSTFVSSSLFLPDPEVELQFQAFLTESFALPSTDKMVSEARQILIAVQGSFELIKKVNTDVSQLLVKLKETELDKNHILDCYQPSEANTQKGINSK